MITLGDNIKKARKKLGLTQGEVADVIGVTSQAVSRWESGAGMPDISLLVPLAQVLSVSIDSLFGYEPENANETLYLELTREYERIDLESETPLDATIAKCRMLCDKCDIHPGNHVYACCYTERVAELSRYLYYNSENEKIMAIWNDSRTRAIRLGAQVIRSCNDPEWVERTHYALAFIYISDKEFENAHEHVMKLPSIDSNRLRESILAQLTFWESGINEMNRVVSFNLQRFVRVINKEILYAVEVMAWKDDPKKTIEFAKWGIRLMKTFTEQEEMLPYCRGFYRDIYRCMIAIDIKENDLNSAVQHWGELKEGMQEHYDYYQKVLKDEALQKRFSERQIGRMRAYTPELIKDRQDEIILKLKEYFGDDKVNEFLALI